MAQLGVIHGTCSYCRGQMTNDDLCLKCRYCGSCGSRFEDGVSFPPCPICNPETVEPGRRRDLGTASTKKDLEGLFHRQVQKREVAIYNPKSPAERKIDLLRTEASFAFASLGLQPVALEDVTWTANRFCKDGMSVKVAIAFAFSTVMRARGDSMNQVIRLLARMPRLQLNAGFQSYKMTVAVRDVNALVILVNGYPRKAKGGGSDGENWGSYLARSKAMTALKIRVPLYLADVADGRVTIQTRDATILEHDKKYRPVKVNDSTVMITLNCEKASFLFKTEKETRLPRDGEPAKFDVNKFDVNKYAGKFMLSPSNFRASFRLALKTGRVSSINTCFLTKFKDLMDESEGRAAKTLALMALKAAGHEEFLLLSDIEKRRLLSEALMMNLSQSDLKKIREDTVLVQSELENCE